MSSSPVTVIVLAAQRAGVVNPLAEEFGVSHKCLVPICGKPLIKHVMNTLTAIPAIREIRISVEAHVHPEIDETLAALQTVRTRIRLVASERGILESVLKAAGDDDGPFIITTADNVLLTREGFERMRDAMADADAVAGLARAQDVRAIHERAQRRFYEFRDGGYANCNIYGLANRKAFAAAEVFREGGQFMKNPARMVRAFGLLNLLMMRAKMISMPAAMRRVGKRFGIRMQGVVFADGALAIDVDNRRTYDIVEPILASRMPQTSTPTLD